MNANELKSNLELLKECELIRYLPKDDNVLELQVVSDEEKKEDESEDEEEEKTPEETPEMISYPDHHTSPHHCSEGLNGHLYSLLFKGVTALSIIGEESDNYKTLAIIPVDHHLRLVYEGINLVGEGGPLELEFDYEDFDVVDHGEIEGPEV